MMATSGCSCWATMAFCKSLHEMQNASKAFADSSLPVSSLLLTGCLRHSSTAKVTGIAVQAG